MSQQTSEAPQAPRGGLRRRFAVGLGAVGVALAISAGAVVMGGDGQEPAAPLGGAAVIGADVRALEAHLKSRPKDDRGWATLGSARVEEARTSGDPAGYPRAADAFERSLKLRREGNDAALAGRAALAAARHDFTGALRDAGQALAVNPYSEQALAVRIDALVELGRYDQALKAAEEADLKRPGIPAFTRLAYVLELRGDTQGANRVLTLAMTSATAPGDIAYVATALGQLTWSQGQYDTALKHCATALRAQPRNIAAQECRARTHAAQGKTAEAIREYEAIVARYPLPGQLVALGELYEAAGKDAEARRQYALIGTWTSLARAGGVNPDLDTALAAADHGDKAVALKAAQAEWQRRRTVHTADALGWALYRNGRAKDALPYARRATATGYRNAVFLYHLGMVEQAAGAKAPARRSLTRALSLNPGFSPLAPAEIRRTLKNSAKETS
ncbi:tetratricopeptide repeat protein [Streptomyces sp. CA-251247]|uniref:tetratricopeptide repeat protein n=1 Tax=Streptomyces sp. CA-251247 TaxID=3240062 RepID=UPI003D9065BC